MDVCTGTEGGQAAIYPAFTQSSLCGPIFIIQYQCVCLPSIPKNGVFFFLSVESCIQLCKVSTRNFFKNVENVVIFCSIFLVCDAMASYRTRSSEVTCEARQEVGERRMCAKEGLLSVSPSNDLPERGAC